MMVMASVPTVDNLYYTYIPAYVMFIIIFTQISDYVFGGEINMALIVTPIYSIMLIAVVIKIILLWDYSDSR